MTRLERLSAANERPALEYLSASPYENVFISYLVLFDASPQSRNKIVVALDGERVTGVAYFGRQLALAADDDALEALADHARRHRGHRMILGARHTVDAFWALTHRWHARPRLVRDRQLVMVVDRERLQRVQAAPVTVRHARKDEWTAVADNSARMIAGELDYDPRRASPDFSANVQRMIERDLWWVGESLGRICFFCNVGPWCTQTVQLQGIWTPPELRGKGLATASLSGICDRLLELTPTVSLYVNDFNAGAIALYHRVGFTQTGEYKTMLF